MEALPPVDVVFCDFLTCTIPSGEWLDFRPGLEAVLDGVFCESPQEGVYLCPLGGFIKVGQRSGVVWVQATGGVLEALRKVGVYMAYLQLFAIRPHRVTRLDAALDLSIDAPPEISRHYLEAVGGKVALTRKAIKPSAVSVVFTPSIFDGRHTGTVYLGRKTAELRLVVYDKREEAFKRTGEDVGHRLRYELRVTGKMGASLKDAWNPASMFWNFLAPGLLSAPPGVSPWVPFTEGGFAVDRPEILPYVRLKRRVEESRELSRLVALADECGPKGRELLCHLLGRYHGLFGGAAEGEGEGEGELALEVG